MYPPTRIADDADILTALEVAGIEWGIGNGRPTANCDLSRMQRAFPQVAFVDMSVSTVGDCFYEAVGALRCSRALRDVGRRCC